MYTSDSSGIHLSKSKVIHRNNEYEESGFNTLIDMQSKHFWYRGRHRFILRELLRFEPKSKLMLIDLGGGCGGWVSYLKKKLSNRIEKIALADSSRVALLEAKKCIDDRVELYQVDLMSLEWDEEWDVAFLLDVIEHCPDDGAIIRQALKALKPGGKLIVTVPALKYFWSYNDVHAKHLRRYSKKDFHRLADDEGLILRDVRYFMFFLSPLLWLSRKVNKRNISEQKLQKAIEREHKSPPAILNWLLTIIFSAETPIGHNIQFPWGTSLLGVFEKKNP